MAGPPKKPAEIALKQGNPGKRSRRRLEAAAMPDASLDAIPDGKDAALQPPAHISPAVRDVWLECIRTPLGQAIIKAGDLPALERLATYYVEWRIYTAALHDKRCKSGLRSTETHKRKKYGDVVKVRPEVALRGQLEVAIKSLEARFGMSPSDRARVMYQLADMRDTRAAPKDVPPRGSEALIRDDGTPPARPVSPIGNLGGSLPRKLN